MLATRVASGELPAPDPDIAAAMYEFVSEGMELAGYEHYEISNWAKPGHRSRHNTCYWTESDYLGIGAGAHGYLDGIRYENVAHPARYIEAIAESSRAVSNAYCPNDTMRAADWLEARLRMLDGFIESDFEATFARPLREVAGTAIAWLTETGVLETDDGRIRLTERGLLLHSEVITECMVEIERHIGPAQPLPANLDAR